MADTLSPEFAAALKAGTAQVQGSTAGSQTYQAVSPTITSQQLQPTQPVQIPTQTPNITPSVAANANTTQSQKSLQDYITQFTPPPTAEQTQASDLTKQIQDLLGQTTGQAQYQASQEQNLGVTDMQKQLAQLNGQSLTNTAEYNQLLKSYQAANLALEQNPQQLAAVVGSKQQELARTQAMDLSQKAAEGQLIAARALALQGHITAAIEQAKKATELKYAPVTEALKIKQDQLKALSDSGILDRQDKIQAAALDAKYKADLQAVEDAKAKEKDIHAIALQAAGNGASPGIIAAIQAAGDLNTATQLATPYLAKVQTQVVEVNGHSLLIDSTTGKTLQDLGKANAIIQSEIAHNNTGGGGLFGNIKPTTTDKRVAQIIQANPGQWGNAADQIDKEFGKGTATIYDSWLKQVYQQGQPVTSLTPLGGSPAKAASDTQNQSAAYATRVSQAGNTIDKLQPTIASYNPISFAAQTNVLTPNVAKSDTVQQYEQASRNLINAILRRESGAAISQSEFDNAYAQYLPKPGDSASTLALKKQNRDAVLNGLINSSGPAYQAPQNNTPITGTTSSGLGYTILP